jgi:hypothetical protein
MAKIPGGLEVAKYYQSSASPPSDFPSVVVVDRARMTVQFGHWS